jgi:hypothetical protein
MNLQDVVTKASLSFAENGLELNSVQQQRSFDVLFKTFIDRLSSIEVVNSPTIGLSHSSAKRFFTDNQTQDWIEFTWI